MTRGPVEFFEDADRLLDEVTRLTDLHEASRAGPWAVRDAPEAFIRAQLRGIVGLRMPIMRIEGKQHPSWGEISAIHEHRGDISPSIQHTGRKGRTDRLRVKAHHQII